ncbi:hypothetical protein [Niastella populi]|uniref:Uncharacterized protein n=1 Tax=Niastella populi TaxID=550983 RepID=A0A1V9GD77_9BACT|nr:hypothetical protein [Niastella populi]OQP68408.1 hypothetical protein A4R26_00955 [Niastella populi]
MTKYSFIPDEMRSFFKENYINDDKESLEQILIAFRKKRCSNIAIVMLLVEQLDISMEKANNILVNSRSLNTSFDDL